jgi:hypothetical protein
MKKRVLSCSTDYQLMSQPTTHNQKIVYKGLLLRVSILWHQPVDYDIFVYSVKELGRSNFSFKQRCEFWPSKSAGIDFGPNLVIRCMEDADDFFVVVWVLFDNKSLQKMFTTAFLFFFLQLFCFSYICCFFDPQNKLGHFQAMYFCMVWRLFPIYILFYLI